MRPSIKLSVLLALALTLALVTSPARADVTEAEVTCNQFMKAMQARDWQGAYNCFSRSFQQHTPYQQWAMFYGTYGQMFTIIHWQVDVKEKNETASGTIEVTSKSGDEEHKVTNKVQMIKENGQWKINSYE